MWLSPVPVHPCPVKKGSWRPQGGGGALQGSAQPEVQGVPQMWPSIQPACQLVEISNGITLVKALHCKVKNGKGNSANSLFTCLHCNNVLSVGFAVLLHLVFQKGWQTSGGGNDGCGGGGDRLPGAMMKL